jgi:hypothetical protein
MHQQLHGANMPTQDQQTTAKLNVGFIAKTLELLAEKSPPRPATDTNAEVRFTRNATCIAAALANELQACGYQDLTDQIYSLVGINFELHPRIADIAAISRVSDGLCNVLRAQQLAVQAMNDFSKANASKLSDPRDQWIGKPLIIYDREMKSKSLKGALIAEYYGRKNILYNVEEENFKHLSGKDIVFIDYQPRCGFTAYSFAERLIERVPA